MSTLRASLLRLGAFVATIASCTAQDENGAGSDNGGGNSLGIILGTVLGIPGGLTLIIYCIRRQCQKKKKAEQQAQPSHEPIDEDQQSPSAPSEEPETASGAHPSDDDLPPDSVSVPVPPDVGVSTKEEVDDVDAALAAYDRISRYVEHAPYG
jgi:cytoskeletal protein RodZ